MLRGGCYTSRHSSFGSGPLHQITVYARNSGPGSPTIAIHFLFWMEKKDPLKKKVPRLGYGPEGSCSEMARAGTCSPLLWSPLFGGWSTRSPFCPLNPLSPWWSLHKCVPLGGAIVLVWGIAVQYEKCPSALAVVHCCCWSAMRGSFHELGAAGTEMGSSPRRFHLYWKVVGAVKAQAPVFSFSLSA